MGAVYKPVKPIEKELRRTYAQAMEQYEALLPDQRKEAAKPALEQISFTDTTVEACQEAMRYSPRGMLTMQDELSGFFGANDRYSGSGKSGASNRGFWLQTWNGGESCEPNPAWRLRHREYRALTLRRHPARPDPQNCR